MDENFIGMHRDMRKIKSLIDTVSSAEFNSIALNSKHSKVVSYIQGNKAWERIYIISKLLFPCRWVLHLADSYKSGVYKVL